MEKRFNIVVDGHVNSETWLTREEAERLRGTLVARHGAPRTKLNPHTATILVVERVTEPVVVVAPLTKAYPPEVQAAAAALAAKG